MRRLHEFTNSRVHAFTSCAGLDFAGGLWFIVSAMQTLSEIRALLDEHGLTPHKRFGQNFLIDKNLLAKLLELAAVGPDDVVLEVGPGTGSLTEELLNLARRVVAVEIDRGLYKLLCDRLGERENLSLICCDALAGKHVIEPKVIEALGSSASLVANLPYSIATPLAAQCLLDSWKAHRGYAGAWRRFDRLTFTVQQEVAHRLIAASDTSDYGPVSVVVSLLGKVRLGPVVPASAFWPPPNVVSRMVRIDFDPQAADALADAPTLEKTLAQAFGQRRKQISSTARRKNAAFEEATFLKALEIAGIDRSVRAEKVTPRQFLAAANALAVAAK